MSADVYFDASGWMVAFHDHALVVAILGTPDELPPRCCLHVMYHPAIPGGEYRCRCGRVYDCVRLPDDLPITLVLHEPLYGWQPRPPEVRH